MNRPFHLSILVGLALLSTACGEQTTAEQSSARPFGPGSGTNSEFLLAQNPEGGVSVLEAKKRAAGDNVTVVGRVRRIDGALAMFTLFDETLQYCQQGEEQCGCETPWDYCCVAEDKGPYSLPVELRDESGMPVKTDNLGIRRLDLVVVKGVLEKTESGNLILVADKGWYRRERPELVGEVDWQRDN